MACVFQTMTSVDLSKWLPSGIPKPWTGHHSNLASPLWQSFTETKDATEEAIGRRETFTQLLTSSDPTTRSFAKQARKGFNDLRNSADPRLRQTMRN
jgi:hypothetical protein